MIANSLIRKCCFAFFVVQVPCLFGQGTLEFANRVVGTVDAPIFDIDGTTRLTGPGFVAQLYAGPPGGSLAPVSVPVSFFATSTAAGYFPLTEVSVPGILPGAIANVEVKAWRVSDGSTFEAASHPGGHVGSAGILAIELAAPKGPPPPQPAYLFGLQSFSLHVVVPEPSILALGLAGLLGFGVRYYAKVRH